MTEGSEARKGRPRPQGTLDRDGTVLAAIKKAPKTREELVSELSLPDGHVYMSLHRLKRDGAIERDGRSWKAAGSASASAAE